VEKNGNLNMRTILLQNTLNTSGPGTKT